MTETVVQHTPGPWRVIDETDILALEGTPQSIVIAGTNFWARPPTDREKADSRLIDFDVETAALRGSTYAACELELLEP